MLNIKSKLFSPNNIRADERSHVQKIIASANHYKHIYQIGELEQLINVIKVVNTFQRFKREVKLDEIKAILPDNLSELADSIKDITKSEHSLNRKTAYSKSAAAVIEILQAKLFVLNPNYSLTT